MASQVVILGSTGFLGKILVRGEYKNSVVLHSRRESKEWLYLQNEAYPFSKLKRELPTVIINCLAGRLMPAEISFQSNFEVPADYFRKIEACVPEFTWIQIESYTQFHQGGYHDRHYVHWKNEFRRFLRLEMSDSKRNLVCVALPHLYGVGDDINRFIPRNFCKILAGKSITIDSPDELMPLLDVQDAAQSIIQLVSSNKGFQEGSLSVHPTDIVTSIELFNSFKEIVGGDSCVKRGDYKPSIFVEPWLKFEQPRVFEFSERNSMHQTLVNIAKDLKTRNG